MRRRTAAALAGVSLFAGLVGPQVYLAATGTTLPAGAPASVAASVAELPEEPFWSYPICAVEDASSGPLPCLWPADKVGNGIGNTFYVEPGPDGTRCFRYVNPTVQRKMGGCE